MTEDQDTPQHSDDALPAPTNHPDTPPELVQAAEGWSRMLSNALAKAGEQPKQAEDDDEAS